MRSLLTFDVASPSPGSSTNAWCRERVPFGATTTTTRLYQARRNARYSVHWKRQFKKLLSLQIGQFFRRQWPTTIRRLEDALLEHFDDDVDDGMSDTSSLVTEDSFQFLETKTPPKGLAIANNDRSVQTLLDLSMQPEVGDGSGSNEQSLDTDTSSLEFPNDSSPTKGPRWAVAAPTTDLSGTWKPIVSEAFKAEYDDYMLKCGEGVFFRKALLSVLGLTREVIHQRDSGRELSITGVTPIGEWVRVLVASGAEPTNSNGINANNSLSNKSNDNYEPIYTQFKDPDGDTVQVEAWWEQNGTVHKSWLRNKPRVMGGEFESTRYLEESTNNNVLVCESVFHPPPNNLKFQHVTVVWKFQRQKIS